MARPSVITRRQDRSAAHVQSRALEKGTEREADRKCVDKISFLHDLFIVLMRILLLHCRKSHIFDGKTVTKETAALQLCDIVDPMLKEMIEDTNDLRETCHVRLFSPPPFTPSLPTHLLIHVNTIGTRRMVHYACLRAHQNCPAAQILLSARRPASDRRGVCGTPGGAGGFYEGDKLVEAQVEGGKT